MKNLYTPKGKPMRLAGFMSGKGTNLKKIIGRAGEPGCPFRVVAVFANRKDEKLCNAKKIAGENSIPFFCNDIKDFYSGKNAEIGDLKVRGDFDRETRKFLEEHEVDAVALCGYDSIITREIFGNFPTLNVHPADLRKKDSSGKRLYAGYNGAETIRAAINNCEDEIRSSVHLVTESVDGGPIILVSDPVKLDISREERVNKGMLKRISEHYLDELKKKGDWVIFPKAVELLAQGKLKEDEDGKISIEGEQQ